MRDLLILLVHLVVTLARLAGPGGRRSVVAESVLVRHDRVGLRRGRRRAPNLRAADRLIIGLAFVALAVPATAQVAGRLAGTVVDRTAASVPNATVSLYLMDGEKPVLDAS